VAGNVTIGLASNWPCDTDISGTPPMGLKPSRGRWAPAYSLLVQYGELYLYLSGIYLLRPKKNIMTNSSISIDWQWYYWVPIFVAKQTAGINSHHNTCRKYLQQCKVHLVHSSCQSNPAFTDKYKTLHKRTRHASFVQTVIWIYDKSTN